MQLYFHALDAVCACFCYRSLSAVIAQVAN